MRVVVVGRASILVVVERRISSSQERKKIGASAFSPTKYVSSVRILSGFVQTSPLPYLLLDLTTSPLYWAGVDSRYETHQVWYEVCTSCYFRHNLNTSPCGLERHET
jgi:hypothetical protein